MPSERVDPVEVAERRTRIYLMRSRQGMTQREIAAALGCTYGEVNRALKAAVKEVPEEERCVIRAIAHDRYEYLYSGLLTVLENDELDATERAMVTGTAAQIVKQTVWLYGAALPQKVDVLHHQVDAVDNELAEMLRKAKEDAIRAEYAMRDPRSDQQGSGPQQPSAA